MALTIQDAVVDRYVRFVKTGRVSRIVEVQSDADPRYANCPRIVVEAASGRRITMEWYSFCTLARPTTALEVLAILGTEPEAE